MEIIYDRNHFQKFWTISDSTAHHLPVIILFRIIRGSLILVPSVARRLLSISWLNQLSLAACLPARLDWTQTTTKRSYNWPNRRQCSPPTAFHSIYSVLQTHQQRLGQLSRLSSGGGGQGSARMRGTQFSGSWVAATLHLKCPKLPIYRTGIIRSALTTTTGRKESSGRCWRWYGLRRRLEFGDESKSD